jgi:EAL domain-containing protein (putative c-di-GMP-specific phosphodiesterase class I)
MFPDHGSNAEDLLRLGEMTARHARAQGASYSIYSGKEETETPYRLSLLAELRVAIRDDALALYYQPKVDIKSGRVTAVEALLRWPHPARGMVPPNHFIPLAEHTGLIKNVTRWVLDAAVRAVGQWHAAGLAIPIAINVSPNNLRDPEFIDRLVNLRTAGVRLELLQLEITETALMQDLDKSREVLIRIRDLGVQIFLDDFGTGFSSLSYIATLPIHALKIDRSFVIHMMREERHRAVVAASVSLAHSLGMKVVAEGVETQEQARTVTEHGCDEIQGYLVSKPLPEDQFLRWHAAFSARPFALA